MPLVLLHITEVIPELQFCLVWALNYVLCYINQSTIILQFLFP
jgi:hypothetical protein